MKKILIFFSLTACFILLSVASTTAQNIHNDTDCDFRVTVFYGPANSCLIASKLTVIVPANGVLNLDLPPGNEIIKATGGYTVPVASASCYFLIGKSQCSFPTDYTALCVGGCGSYRATLTQVGIGISN